MFRPVIRGKTSQWHSTAGYVCRSCRNRLAYQQQATTATQRRHESTDTGTASAPSFLDGIGAEGWEKNLNRQDVDLKAEDAATTGQLSTKLQVEEQDTGDTEAFSAHKHATLPEHREAAVGTAPGLAQSHSIQDLLAKLNGVSGDAGLSASMQKISSRRNRALIPPSNKKKAIVKEALASHGVDPSSGGNGLLRTENYVHSDTSKNLGGTTEREEFEQTMARLWADNSPRANSTLHTSRQGRAQLNSRQLPPVVVDDVSFPEVVVVDSTDTLGSDPKSDLEVSATTRRQNPFRFRNHGHTELSKRTTSSATFTSSTEARVPATDFDGMQTQAPLRKTAALIRRTKSRPGWGGGLESPILKKSSDRTLLAEDESPHAEEHLTALAGDIEERELDTLAPNFAISPGDLAEDDTAMADVGKSGATLPKQHSPPQKTKSAAAATVDVYAHPLSSKPRTAGSGAESKTRRQLSDPKHHPTNGKNSKTVEAVAEPTLHDSRFAKASRQGSEEAGSVHSLPSATNMKSLRLNPGDPAGTNSNHHRPRAASLSNFGKNRKIMKNSGNELSEDATATMLNNTSQVDAESLLDQEAVSKGESSQVTGENAVSSSSSDEASVEQAGVGSIQTDDLEVTPLHIPQPPVPPLQYGLDRVLFNPGLYQLQDPRSRVYNFDPYLEKVMPLSEFDFNALKVYKTSSQDEVLSNLAKDNGKKYVGSTSSMTGVLGQFHYLLSNWRELNLDMLSKGFAEKNAMFTQLNRAPSAIFLRWKHGTYAIDADKEFDGANVLMMLGKSMEKVLTLPREEYERYRRDNTANPITDLEKDEPEAFEYTTHGDFLMRSQLDAHDPRLPGTGMFDLKTRAVLTIRMDAEDYEDLIGYELLTPQGTWESYEREYYDMMRSTMLKYSLQVRMGRMDGIFVAYHNIERIFGFQYLPLSEIDRALHGQVSTRLGDLEFKASLKLLNGVFNMATAALPGATLRIHFEAVPAPANMMWVFAEAVSEDEANDIQGRSKRRVEEFEAKVMGLTPESERKADAVVDKAPTSKASVENAEEVSLQDTGSTAEVSATIPANDGNATRSKETMAATSINKYNSSNGPADPQFYERITPAVKAEGLKPLFAATILVQNFVNGVTCEGNRPVNLKPTDKWEVKYILKEAPLDGAQKWARYEDCKARRKKALWGPEEEQSSIDESEDGESAKVEPAAESKHETRYRDFLKRMVEHGKEYRRMLDKLDEGREKVVVGVPNTVSGE